jgi:phosphatidate cytidylyltransferase
MFWTRLASGIVLVLIALLALGLGGSFLLLVLFGISIAAYRELTLALRVGSRETDKVQLNGLEVAGILGIAAYDAILFFYPIPIFMLMGIVGVFMAQLILYVVCFPKYKAEQVASAFFAFIYAPVMLAFVYLTRQDEVGIYVVWLILITAWGSDTCAYVVGMLFGRKKIFPVLSPKKSLEGCIGGVVGAGLIGWLYGFFWVNRMAPGVSLEWEIAFICAIAAVISQVGDLAASGIKRDVGIKDYGKLIPGHGGVMDRFDSMIVTAPVIYFLSVMLMEF